MKDDLEEKYPGAKITRGGAQPAPEGYSSNRIGENKVEMEAPRNRSDARTLAPYEVKAAKFSRTGGGGSSGVLPNDSKSGLDRPHLYNKGGRVKTFRHHDGIAQRGKTRA
jgi:hypothetical protein